MKRSIAAPRKYQPALGDDSTLSAGRSQFRGQMNTLQRRMRAQPCIVAERYLPRDLTGVQIDSGQVTVRRFQQGKAVMEGRMGPGTHYKIGLGLFGIGLYQLRDRRLIRRLYVQHPRFRIECAASPIRS